MQAKGKPGVRPKKIKKRGAIIVINQKTKISSALTALAVMCVTALMGSLAHAQLEEILVTAQKREASLQDTPISITAFDAAAIEAEGIFDVRDMGPLAVNVQINSQPASEDNIGMNIRGVGEGETHLLAEPTVGIYIDGVYIARMTGALFEVVDLERVEVLRGPQGTLYGRNTIGGAINLIAAKPSEDFGFKQAFTYGNRNRYRSNTSVDTGLLAGGWSAKFSFNKSGHGGLLDNDYHDNKLGKKESEAWRMALRWQPNEDFTLDFTIDETNRLSNASLNQLTGIRQPHASMGGAITQQAVAASSPNRLSSMPAYFSPDMDSTSDIEMYTLTAEWDLNPDMTVKYIGSAREWNSGTTGTDFGSFPSDGATVMNDPAGPAVGTFVPAGDMVSLFYANRVSDNKQKSHELQILGNLADDTIEYVLGAYFFEEQSNEVNPQQFVMPAAIALGQSDILTQNLLCGNNLPLLVALGVLPPGTPGSIPNPMQCMGKDVVLSAPDFRYGSDFESQAFFAHVTWNVSDQLSVTFGARHTEDDKYGYVVNTGLDEEAQKDFSNSSISANITFQPNDDFMGYLTYSEGYRSGGYTPRAGTAAQFANGYDEETVTNYEVGIKSEWLDSRVRLNAAYYYLEYEDKQVASFQAGAAGATSTILNAGLLDIDGFEIELTAQLTDAMRLNLNYGQVNLDYEEFITQRQDPVTSFPCNPFGVPCGVSSAYDPLTGNDNIADIASQQQAPDSNMSAILSYQFPSTGWANIEGRVSVTYRDEYSFHPQLVLYDSTDSQTRVNARLTFSEIAIAGGQLTVAAWGKNLGDKDHREWGIDFAALGPIVNNYLERRSFGVDLIWQY